MRHEMKVNPGPHPSCLTPSTRHKERRVGSPPQRMGMGIGKGEGRIRVSALLARLGLPDGDPCRRRSSAAGESDDGDFDVA